jgi:predicted ATPase
MLTYSPRERFWFFEIDEIRDEGITPNVLDLLSAKMTACSSGLRVGVIITYLACSNLNTSHSSKIIVWSQVALQVASCFGIRVDSLVVKALSGTSRYSNLTIDLNKAVDDGMMDLGPDGSNYKFVHDKVREAAYDMISTNDKDRFHFDIGMLLLSSFGDRTEEKSKILFYILDQINHGVPDLLQDEEQRVMIVKMNHEVASQMMHSYNYTAAYQYSERAVALLPENCWSQSDDISIDVYFLLSKAAYSNGKIDRAMVSNWHWNW